MSAQRRLNLVRNAEPRAPETGADAIATWLNVLDRMLRLPEAERRGIREELNAHLRERVRDLLLAGHGEAEGVRIALAELGDTAQLARRFHEAGRTKFRRMAMNMLVIGVAGAALLTSVVAINGQRERQPVSIYSPLAASAPERTPPRSPTIAGASFDEQPLPDVLQKVAADAGLTLTVHWGPLGEAGVEKDTTVTVHSGPTDLAGLFRQINSTWRPEQAIDYRIDGKSLQVGPRSYFDALETELVSLEIADVLALGVTSEQLMNAITTFIDSDLWEENGGQSGRLSVVGQKLFVRAPTRMWGGAAWIVAQLGGDGQVSKGADAMLLPNARSLMDAGRSPELPLLKPGGPVGLHTVREGETLQSIARIRIGHEHYAPEILKVNPQLAQRENPGNLRVGEDISIPTMAGVKLDPRFPLRPAPGQ
jgi:hypothetical protein